MTMAPQDTFQRGKEGIMSVEERLKLIIGDLVMRLAILESEKETISSELAQLKSNSLEKIQQDD
jgi:hypothetical protein